jgi:hypothetical protein
MSEAHFCNDFKNKSFINEIILSSSSLVELLTDKCEPFKGSIFHELETSNKLSIFSTFFVGFKLFLFKSLKNFTNLDINFR